MVSARKAPDGGKKKRSDMWAGTAFAASLALMLWIGYDLYQGMMFRQDFISRVNAAVRQNDRGAPSQALEALLALQDEWFEKQHGTPADAILQRFTPTSMDLGQHLSVVHGNIADRYSQAQLPDMAIRHQSLALTYGRDLRSMARNLAQDCFFVKNYELGWIAAKAVQNTPGGGTAGASLLRNFDRHYQGLRYTTVPE